jgi:hypothetical protein
MVLFELVLLLDLFAEEIILPSSLTHGLTAAHDQAFSKMPAKRFMIQSQNNEAENCE